MVRWKQPAVLRGSVADRALRVLKKLGPDQHLTTAELAELVAVTPHTFREHSSHPALTPYRKRVRLNKFISETGHGGPCVWWHGPKYDPDRDIRLNAALRGGLPVTSQEEILKEIQNSQAKRGETYVTD